MKTTSEYIALLRKYMAENAHKYGIVRMGIFGSVARGEQTENSDVDVCVEGQLHGFFALAGIKQVLKMIFRSYQISVCSLPSTLSLWIRLAQMQ